VTTGEADFRYAERIQSWLEDFTALLMKIEVLWNMMAYWCHSLFVRLHLLKTIKDLSGDKNKFKLALKSYLLHNSFYSLKEYFDT